MSVGEETRSHDRELIATTSSLVEFLRDVALARQRARARRRATTRPCSGWTTCRSQVSVELDAGPGETLFSIPRLRPEAPPEPPAALTNWLDKEAMRDSSAQSPVLKEKGPAWVVVKQPDGARACRRRCCRWPRRPTSAKAFKSYLPSWQAWAARDRQHAPFRKWYTALAAAANLVSQQEDQYEIVLGTGLLAWRSASGTEVRNHILTTRLIAVVDPESDSVRVMVDPDGATRAQDRELLDGEPGYDPVRVENVHDQVRDDAVVAPLVDCERLVKQWAERALDDETPFISQWAPVTRVEANGEVRLAPAVVVRRRERASLIGYYDAMLQALRGPKAQAPLGLAQLVTAMEANERLAWLDRGRRGLGRGARRRPAVPVAGQPRADAHHGAPARQQRRGRAGPARHRQDAHDRQPHLGAAGTGPAGAGHQPEGTGAAGAAGQAAGRGGQALRLGDRSRPRRRRPSSRAASRRCPTGTRRSMRPLTTMRWPAPSSAGPTCRPGSTRSPTRCAPCARPRSRATRRWRPGTRARSATSPAGCTRRSPRLGWLPVPVPTEAPPLTAAEALGAAAAARRPDAGTGRPAAPAQRRRRRLSVGRAAARDDRGRDGTHAGVAAGATETSARLAGADGEIFDRIQSAVDNARQATTLLGLDADPTKWPTTDWAARAISEGLGGYNTTLWRQLTAERRPGRGGPAVR